MTNAKRGDLVAIVTTTTDYVIGSGRSERTSVELGEVTSVTRDGLVKAWRDYSGGTRKHDAMRARALVVSRADIDTAGALDAYGTRRYPTAPHSSMVPPFGSLDEARAMLRPFRRELARQ